MTPIYQPDVPYSVTPAVTLSIYPLINSTPTSPPEITIERVDKLPVVFAILRQMGVQQIIDEHYVAHGNHTGLSVGWLALIFLLYILTEANHKMVSVQQWEREHHHTLQQLIGQPIRETDLSDDRLADVLRYLNQDKLWWSIEADLSQRLIRVYDLDSGATVRLDATTGGVKHNEATHELFKTGRNKAGNLETQFKVMLASLDPLGLALAADVVSGDTADDPLYTPIYQRIRQTLGVAGRLYVGDSKMAALDNRLAMALGGDFYLAPLPLTGQTPALLSELLLLAQAGYFTLNPIYPAEVQSDDPTIELDPTLALAEGFELVREQQATLEDGRLVTWSERLFVIRSHAFAKAQIKSFERRLTEAESQILALTPPPGRGKRQFNDQLALQQAIEPILTRYHVSDYFEVTLIPQTSTRHIRAYGGRPARTEHKVRYQVQLARRHSQIEQAKWQLGWRIYASNAPQHKLKLAQAVLVYRSQYLVEGNFARFKGPLLALLPLYVHRDDHALGLIRLLTIALRALSIIEFVVRRSLDDTQSTLVGLYDGNPKRATSRPSAELLLHAFDNINLVIQSSTHHLLVTPQLTPLQQQILALLQLAPDIYTCLTANQPIWPMFTRSLGSLKPLAG